MSGAGSREQVGRMLALVPYLNARGAVHVDQAARDLGVTPQQVVKDLRVLFLCGLPGGYPDDLIEVDIDALVEPDGDRLIRMSNADYLDRPLRLSPTEASALVVALRVLRTHAAPATRDVVDRALLKIETALGGQTATIDPGEGPAVRGRDAEIVDTLREAVAARRQLTIDYHVPSRDEVSTRVVDPARLVEHGGLLYLEAWCHTADAPRTFRVDRVHAARVLPTPVATEHDEVAPSDPEAGPEQLFVPPPGSTLVTLRLDAEVRWVPDYYPVEAVRPAGDGAVEVDLRVADARWLQRLLLRLAPHARVLAPAGPGDELAERARQALRHYR
ncbi:MULTISPECIES: WYL domain-containing protein [unclassified Nocardioides]|uniref:helix-turn-helix transcriptional regulator n=1 Tax=unclassified Nocardioides TaxID=2615069 RepID=UPI002407644B|nr:MULTISPECIES: WYL domain-containing protein [unclassified Nocardioides]